MLCRAVGWDRNNDFPVRFLPMVLFKTHKNILSSYQMPWFQGVNNFYELKYSGRRQ